MLWTLMEKLLFAETIIESSIDDGPINHGEGGKLRTPWNISD